MPATTQKTRVAFAARTARVASSSLATFTALASLASDYQDVYAAEMTAGDFTGTATTPLAGYSLDDLTTLMGGVVQLNALLDTNNGALRLAVKRLAQFSR